MKWIDGIKEVQLRDNNPNHIGTRHKCVREGGGDPELVTSDVKVTDAAMEFWETDVKKMASCRYLVQKTRDGATDLVVQFFVRGNVLVKLMFKTLIEKKVKAGFEKSLANLGVLCEKAAR